MSWDDLQVFLAVARHGTLGAAARALGQTQPTMGRRLRALEAALGHPLFQRTTYGLVLTDDGLSALPHAERMADEAHGLRRALTGSEAGLEGLLRISCSDWFGVTLLAPVLAEYGALHPGVTVELLTDPRLYSLARREADLAFRITPFEDPEVVSRRLMSIPYGVYAKAGTAAPIGDGAGSAIVVMDTAFSGMPDVGWITARLPKARIAARSNNREVQARLCALGMGMAVLPRPLGDATAGIERIDLGATPPGRDTWIGYHRDLRRNGRLRALVDLAILRLAAQTSA